MINRNRRDLLKSVPFLTLAGGLGLLNLQEVKEVKQWEKVPNFQDGDLLRADMLNALTRCIGQLQQEVETLRKAQG